MNNPHSTTEQNVPEQSARTGSSRRSRTLRAWPALVFAFLIIAARFAPRISEEAAVKYWMIAVFGPLLCCLLLLIWWLAASRATWRERVFGLFGLIAGAAIAVALDHPTMRGAATSYLTLPLGFFIFGLTAFVLKSEPPAVRSTMAVLLAFGGFAFTAVLRSDGMTGDYKFAFKSRWKRSAEDTFLAARKSEAQAPARTKATPQMNASTAKNALAHPEWAQFRGADRAGRSLGPKIATNWTTNPPEELWKIQVGPGWSSFAVAGHILFTQEQRGPKETVVCYDADSGKEVWKTDFDARLEDPMGGPGPRATPTLANGALYVAGSTGQFLRLDPITGQLIWQKDLTKIAGTKTPLWGFSDSPLVLGTNVIVYAGGGDKGLLALDTVTGDLRWSAPCPTDSYSSPQVNSLLGEDSIVMLTKSGLLLLDPANGKTRLDYDWKIPQYRALQPHVVGTDTVLLPTGMNMGTRAIRLKKANGQYTAEELWTARKLSPDFSDLVTYKGYAYGNDGGMLACLDLQTGDRKWKGGRYGKGQILLLENSGLLLILSEKGQVVLVTADPNDQHELASFQALEGKTWNHPVVVGDRLYVRNSEQAAAYKLRLQ